MSKPEQQYAFPVPDGAAFCGMTVRQVFAAFAMIPLYLEGRISGGGPPARVRLYSPKQLAERAYRMADAMIAEGSKTNEDE